MNVADLITHFLLVSFPGPPSPNVTNIQVTSGRSLGIAVYWVTVQGAENYMAWTTNGQNCSATASSYCFITPVECGQNHSVSVIAYNKAGPSSPSQPGDYITCGYSTHSHSHAQQTVLFGIFINLAFFFIITVNTSDS